jgi:hypothetical protein
MRASICILLALLVAVPLGAEAAKKKKKTDKTNKAAASAAKKYFKSAELEYKLGRFDVALKQYSKAYEALPAPEFLFNIGQCHRNLGDLERALYFFRGFLNATKDDAAKKRTRDLIAQLETKLKEERREARRALEAAVVASTATISVQTRTTTTVVFVPAPAQPPPEAETPAWPFLIAAAVVVAVAGGVAVAVAAGGDDLPGGFTRDRIIDWSDQ